MSEDDVVAKACLEKLLVGQESDERKVQLVERISQSPYWSNQAGHLLDDQTFSQADEVLAKSVAQDPSLSLEALKYWGKYKHYQTRELFVQSVLQGTPEQVYELFTRTKHAKEHIGAVIERVCESPVLSFDMLRIFKFPDFKIHDYRPKLYEAVAQSPEVCVDAVVYLNDIGLWNMGEAEFWRYGKSLFLSVVGNQEARKKAEQTWDEKNRLFLYLQKGSPNDPFMYDEKRRKCWFALAVENQMDEYVRLSERVFDGVVEVYRIAVDNGHKDSFKKGFAAVLDSGNVEQWVNHILEKENKDEDAIGGDTYDRISSGTS